MCVRRPATPVTPSCTGTNCLSKFSRVCVREIKQGDGQFVPISVVSSSSTCPNGTRVLDLCKNPSDFQPSSYLFMSYWYKNVYLPNPNTQLALAQPTFTRLAHADAPDWCKFEEPSQAPPPCPPEVPACPSCDSSVYTCRYEPSSSCSSSRNFNWRNRLGSSWMNSCDGKSCGTRSTCN